jgi:hypothetical protein
MITEEIIYKTNQEREFLKIKNDIKKAIHSIDSAIHYLQETCNYDSDVLDIAVDELTDVKERLKLLVEE